MMRQWIIGLSFLVAFLGSLFTPGRLLAWQMEPLEVGETYSYKIKWLGMPVARMEVRVKSLEQIDGREVYVVEVEGKTNRFASVFYPVKDRFVSYIDKEKWVPLKLEESRREGTYKKDARTIFDHENGIAYFENFLDGSKKQYPISPRLQDIISLFCALRQNQIEVHGTHHYELMFAEELFLIEGKADKKMRVRLDNGKVKEAFFTKPVAKQNGEIVKKGTGTCYFSSDGYQVPVYFELKAPIFTKITAVLAEASVF